MSKKEIILLWYKTQRGHIDECRKAQLEFADIMWELYTDVSAFKDIGEE